MGQFLTVLRHATETDRGSSLDLNEVLENIAYFEDDIEEGLRDIATFCKDDLSQDYRITVDPSVINLFWAYGQQQKRGEYQRTVATAEIVSEARFAFQGDSELSQTDLDDLTRKATERGILGAEQVRGIVRSEIVKWGQPITIEPKELQTKPAIPDTAKDSSPERLNDLDARLARLKQKVADLRSRSLREAEANLKKNTGVASFKPEAIPHSAGTVTERHVEANLSGWQKFLVCINPFDGLSCRSWKTRDLTEFAPDPKVLAALKDRRSPLSRSIGIVKRLMKQERRITALAEEAKRHDDFNRLLLIVPRITGVREDLEVAEEFLTKMYKAVAQGDTRLVKHLENCIEIIADKINRSVQAAETAPVEPGRTIVTVEAPAVDEP